MKRAVIRTAGGQEDFFRLIRLREAVFVLEQGVPLEIELDDLDDRAIHFVAESGGKVVGTARLVVEGKVGKIGRMAVEKGWRRRGIGGDLIGFIKKKADEMRLDALVLHAQETAVSFYERLGFAAEGERFEEAGLPHRKMRLSPLSPPA